MFSAVIVDIIIKYLSQFELLPWICEYESSELSDNKNYYIQKLHWFNLSRNPHAIDLLEQNQDKINWDWLSLNSNAISLLEQNKDKINWNNLSQNLNAIHLLEQNQDKINWGCLNKDKINWHFLSINPSAINLLQQNKDKINWFDIAQNPSISVQTNKIKIQEHLFSIKC